METLEPKTITRLLHGVRAGDGVAAESLLPLVYSELQGLAGSMFSSERKNHTLQPTALVHEAWIKLSGHLDKLTDRRHFFIIASRAMRQILTDYARRDKSDKRGGGQRMLTLDEGFGSVKDDAIELIELDDLLVQLAGLKPRHAQVVELRILGGLTIADTAEALGVSHGTVEGDWFTAKAWMRSELSGAQ